MALRRILIIDDSRPIRMALQSFLEQNGVLPSLIAHSETYEDGKKAFETGAPEVVFLDLEMEGADALETGAHMLEKNPNLKVVITTSAPPEDPRLRQAIEQGAFDILRKPVRMDAVRRLLQLLDQEGGGLKRIG